MRLLTRSALGLALALAAGSASAQQAPGSELGKSERAALLALTTALDARNYPAATTALNTAQASARTGYARYLASALQLRLGIESNNYGLQSSAIDAMVASGAAPAAELPQLLQNQGALAVSAGKLDKAETAYTRWAELAPNDPAALLALSQVKNDRKKTAEAIALLDRAIDIRQAAGQPVPESWRKRGLKLAFDTRLGPQSAKFSRGLVAHYPTPENWRDALLAYRDVTPPDEAGRLDLMRLMRSTKALGGERDYLELAQALNAAGLGAEAKAVLDEGVAGKMVDPTKGGFKELIAAAAKKAAAERAGLAGLQTKALGADTGTAALGAGDKLFGAGDYAKAATLYRAAVAKGSVDADIANTRLGMALALAGQRAEAEAALRAVSARRSDLAGFWLLWLGQRA